MRPMLLAGAVACGVLAPSAARAQDTQYWMSAYGTKAQLLGGLVIGSVQDVSATYYNPGALALFSRAEAILSGSAYRLSTITNEDGLGEGRSISTTSIASLPGMLAGEIPTSFLGQGRLAYSIFTRHVFDGRAEARGLTADSGLNVPDLQFFSGDVAVEESLNETWVGLTWSQPLRANLGFGITQFVAVRNEHARFSMLAQALDSTGDAAMAVQGRDFQYSHTRLLWKLGLGLRQPKWTAGVTVTTPSLALFGSGSAGRSATLVDQGVATTPTTVLATDYQEGVKATYQSPLSVGAGGSFTVGATRLHAAVEWFAGVDEFHVLETETFLAQSSGAVMTNDVIEHVESVVNFGVGLEHSFNSKLTAYVAYRTDRSPLPDSSAANSTLSRWDLAHVSGGVAFTIGRLDLVVGTDLTAGGSKSRTPDGIIPGEPAIPADARIKYFAATLLIGFRFGFGAER